jgi:hypothetical protein
MFKAVRVLSATIDEHMPSFGYSSVRSFCLAGGLVGALVALVPFVAQAQRPARLNGRSALLHLYSSYAPKIEQRFADDYQRVLRSGLTDTPANKELFLKTFFVYSLIHDQGILGNLWELVDNYPTGDRRMPTTMFREAFSPRAAPPITQPRGENTAATTCTGFSHGRCDRLEMEFIALLSFFGIKSEMYMCGPIHVRTEVPIGGHYLIFDNSFSGFKLLDAPGLRVQPAEPYNIKYVNRLALSEAARIASLSLDPAGVTRVEKAVENFLAGQAPVWCSGTLTTRDTERLRE